ncbi:hypothetical protein, partial [Latilactobacillus fuchuensis]|uniref:hypothetical protein n=1 Tax=Latilactobacillus fuchuensis TaxID=164393 RepID=UPI0039B06C23
VKYGMIGDDKFIEGNITANISYDSLINQLQCLLDSDYSPTVKLAEIQRLVDDQRDQWQPDWADSIDD